MLIHVIIENVLSMKEELEWNMIPASLKTREDDLKEYTLNGKKYSLLPLGVIYGANACGKSNWVKALAWAQKFIVRGNLKDDSLPYQPYKLDPEKRKEPSKFEFRIVVEGRVYTYGFAFSKDQVEEEWLYAFFSSKESCIFHREANTLRIGSKFHKLLPTTLQGVDPNVLFLTRMESTCDVLQQVYRWFRNTLLLIPNTPLYRKLARRLSEDTEFAIQISAFLQEMDTEITMISAEKKSLESILPEKIRKKLLGDISSEGRDFLFVPYTEHKDIRGDSVRFKLSEESHGTNKLLQLLPTLLLLKSEQKVVIADEIDGSLHTIVTQWFLSKVAEFTKGKKNESQFICTTHDTHLIRLDCLRPDEIWFMEKTDGATHIARLSEYRISDGSNLEKGYLAGRFGGIPVLN